MMSNHRSDALVTLERLGVRGHDIYLLDVVPLCEMAMVDEVLHPRERELILWFLEEHIEQVNADAQAQLLNRTQALRFVEWLLTLPQAKLRQLRALMGVVRLQSTGGEQQARRILEAVEAVGAAAPSPAEPTFLWDKRELDCMWDLQEQLLLSAHRRPEVELLR